MTKQEWFLTKKAQREVQRRLKAEVKGHNGHWIGIAPYRLKVPKTIGVAFYCNTCKRILGVSIILEDIFVRAGLMVSQNALASITSTEGPYQ